MDSSVQQAAWLVPANAQQGQAPVDTLWALNQDASRLLRLSINGVSGAANAVTGKTFGLDSPAQGSVTEVKGTYSIAVSPQGTEMAFLTLMGTSQRFAMVSATLAPVQNDSVNGLWRASLKGEVMSWSIGNLAITGSSTTGCTYAGNLHPLSGLSAYEVSLTETCAGAVLSLAGLVSVNATRDRMTVVAITADDSRATALPFVKSP